MTSLQWPATGFILVLGIYVLSTILYVLRYIINNQYFSIHGLRTTLLGFILHASFFIWHLTIHGYPFFRSSFETYQITSGTIVFIFLLLSFFYRFLATGVIWMPIALIFYILSLTHIVSYHTPGHWLSNPWAFVHIVFIFLSMATFIVSFVTGMLYLIQENRIKRKVFGGMWDRFPSLEVMDVIHYRALYVAFIFFTIGIITGGGWSKTIYGVYVTNNVKQLVSFGLWIFFAVFLNLRVSHGWVGRKGILLSTIGFLAVFFLFSWVQR